MDVKMKSLSNFNWDFKSTVPYVDDWFLMGSPWPVTIITLLYLLAVYVGPKVMKTREPVKLNTFLVYYNMAQVIFSAYMVILGFKFMKVQGLINKTCLMKDENVTREITSGMYIYFIAKVSEVLDTIFFILRKKQNQITFLHVYHHAIMILFPWYSLKFEPSYIFTFTGTINSFIHVIMYGYYALSAFPSLTKYLWWKNYLTALQLVQFVFIILHLIANCFIGSCPPTTVHITMVMINTSFFIFLFGRFYYNSYIRKPSKDKKT